MTADFQRSAPGFRWTVYLDAFKCLESGKTIFSALSLMYSSARSADVTEVPIGCGGEEEEQEEEEEPPVI